MTTRAAHNQQPGHPPSQEERHGYPLIEEIANCATHGLGALLSLAGLVVLLVFAAMHGTGRHLVGFAVFGGTLILLYLASTLYHGFPQPRLKRLFKKLDHAAIFLLIAGTYTPFLVLRIKGTMGWSLLGIVWGLAVLGVAFKCMSATRFRRLSVGVYLGMGWLCLVAVKQMLASVPPLGLVLLLLGGLSYTLGVVFYVWKRLPFNHALWHCFVLAGSTFHYFSVFTCLPS